MTKTILIIKAMAEEMVSLDKILTYDKKHVVGAYCFFESCYQGFNIITSICGIGKVNAATCTTIGCILYQPDIVINAGVAGGLHADLRVGDVIVASELKYHDADVTAFGYAHGQIPRMPASYQSHPAWQQFLKFDYPFQVVYGLVCSGDSFVANQQVVLEIQNKIPGIFGLDMESCAIAQACHQLQVPFFCLRSVSDAANDTAKQSYEQSLVIAVNNVTQVLLDILAAYRQKEESGSEQGVLYSHSRSR